MRYSKVYYHSSGYLLIWCRSLGCYYLAKNLRSGKLKKHYTGGYSYNSNYHKAITDIRRSVKIPASGWNRKRISYANSIEAFDNAIKSIA